MNPFDAEPDVPSPTTGIDRSIGYLAIGLVMALVFVAAVVGMSSMERLSSQTTEATMRPNEPAPASEIVGAGAEARR